MSKYSGEFVAMLVEAYTAAEGYDAQQEVIKEMVATKAAPKGETPYTVAGLRAKLSREGVYEAKETTTAGKSVRKADLVAQLALLIDTPEIELDTFEKATRKALEILVGRIRAIKKA